MVDEAMEDTYDPIVWLRPHVDREIAGRVDPKRAEDLLQEALRWCARWLHAQLRVRSERELADLTALSWTAWHQPRHGRGLAFMYDWVAGRSREDAWLEALHERYQRTLARLADRVALRRAGRSVLDFRSSEDVQHYFAACVSRDVRRLLAGDRRRSDDEPEDVVLVGSADAEGEVAALRIDLARQSDLTARHFAAYWTLADHRGDLPACSPFADRRSQDWAMLRHWCDAVAAPGTGKKGGLRNEPRRVGERYDARQQVCVGARDRLGAWASRMSLVITEDLLSEQPLVAWESAVREALSAWLNAEVDSAIGRLPATTREREALLGTLLRGELVRIDAFEGATPDERRHRAHQLCLMIGSSVAGRPPRVPPPPTGPGPCHPQWRRQVTPLLAGRVPTATELQALHEGLSCPACRAWWFEQCAAVVEAAEEGLALPEAPAEAPQRWWQWWFVPAFGGVLAAVLLVIGLASPPTTVRLAPDGLGVEMSLQVDGPDGRARYRLDTIPSRLAAGSSLWVQVDTLDMVDASVQSVVVRAWASADGDLVPLLIAERKRGEELQLHLSRALPLDRPVRIVIAAGPDLPLEVDWADIDDIAVRTIHVGPEL